jgi:hypothetical protein
MTTRGVRSALGIVGFFLFIIWVAVEEPFFKEHPTRPSVDATGKPARWRPAPRSGVYYGPDGKEVALPPPAAEPARPQRRRRPGTYYLPAEGSVVRLYGKQPTVAVGTDQGALDEFGEAGRVRDDHRARLLVLSRRIVMVESGTRARVLDLGFSAHEVRILEGRHEGARVWVLKEFVRR